MNTEWTETYIFRYWSVLKTLDKGVKSLRIRSPGEKPMSITPRVKAVIKQMERTARVPPKIWRTAIRGRLDQITVGVDTPQFRIIHGLTGAKIPCSFKSAQLEEIKRYLPARVEVRGEAKVTRQGSPRHITVFDLRRLPEDTDISNLPSVNITDGMDSFEYVEKIRAGDESN